MQNKIGIVGAASVVGSLLGYIWIHAVAAQAGWHDTTYSSVAVGGIIELAAVFCAVWSAVTMATLTYALITPRVSRVVACVSLAFLCFMALWTVAGAGGKHGDV